MQGTDLQVFGPAGARDRLVALLNLALPRQEDQDRFMVLALVEPLGFQGPHHLGRQGFALPGRLVLDGHREAPPFAGEQRRLRELFAQGLEVQRRRHHQEAHLRGNQRAGLPQQGQGEVRLAAALVEFIEDHAGHPLQAGVGLQLPQEEAVGQDLDPSGRRHAAFQANPIADPFADLLPQAAGQALGRGFGGQATRLEHQDAAALRRQRLEQR